MEDISLINTLQRHKLKIIIIIGAIIIIGLGGYLVYKTIYTHKTINYLKSQNFEEKAEKVYSKYIDNGYKKTYYMYNLNTNEFSKDITINNKNSQEYIMLIYKEKTTKITYNYRDTKRCILNQDGEYKNGNFKCIVNENKNCKTKCSKLLKLMKNFKKETENNIKKINS